ncbi:MAG: hypothetical protein H0X30_20460, partial [Anaerolineae bacterium]|nr:hypothetical protein [Anaerolineae bacterium]
MMQIVPFEATHVTDVTRLVNAQIAPIPPHWTLTKSQVTAILQQDSLWEIHYADEEAPPWTWHNEIICVVEDEHVHAAARFDHTYDHGQIGTASARWLVSHPQYPAALNLLLDHLIAKRGDTTASI